MTMTCIRYRVVDQETRRREVEGLSRSRLKRHQLPNRTFDLVIATIDCLAPPSLRSDPTSLSHSLILISTPAEHRVLAILPSTINLSTTFPVSLHRETMDSSHPCEQSRGDTVDRPVLANQLKLDSLPIRPITRGHVRTVTHSPPSITLAIFDILRRPARLLSHRSILHPARCLPTTIYPSSLR